MLVPSYSRTIGWTAATMRPPSMSCVSSRRSAAAGGGAVVGANRSPTELSTKRCTTRLALTTSSVGTTGCDHVTAKSLAGDESRTFELPRPAGEVSALDHLHLLLAVMVTGRRRHRVELGDLVRSEHNV